MRYVDCEQRSAEWFWARCGRITASRMCDLMAVLKRGGEATARSNYRIELLAERLSGKVEDHYVSKEMLFGEEQEPFARTAYELRAGNEVDPLGFIFHPVHDFSGASPDGLIGTDGGLEIKVPKTTTHLGYMAAGVVPEEYIDQIQWNMACAEREWWEFCSFDPRLPDKARLFIIRVPRDDARIKVIEEQVLRMHAEVDYIIAELGLESTLPPIESFVVQPKAKKPAGRTERIGAHDVPADIAEMFSEEIMP